MEGASELLFAVLGHALEGLGGRADFLFALRREALEGLIARHDAGTYARGLRVKIAEAVDNPAALPGSEAIEAGLAAQSTLLLLDAHVLVMLEPLGEMFAGGILSRVHVEPALGSTLRLARKTPALRGAHPACARARRLAVMLPGTRQCGLRKHEQGCEQGNLRRPARSAARAGEARLLSEDIPRHGGRSHVDGASFGASFHVVVSPREPGGSLRHCTAASLRSLPVILCN